MSRHLCITAADGQTGYLITELLLTDQTFSKKIKSVSCLTLNPNSQYAKNFKNWAQKS